MAGNAEEEEEEEDSLKAVLNWKRTQTFARAQQAPLFLN